MKFAQTFSALCGNGGERRRRRGGVLHRRARSEMLPARGVSSPRRTRRRCRMPVQLPGCLHSFIRRGNGSGQTGQSTRVLARPRQTAPGKAARNRTLLHARAPPSRWSDQTLRGSAAGASAPRCPCPRRARPRARVPARRRRPPTHGRRGLPDAGRVGAPCQVMVPAHIPASMMPAGQARTPTKPETAPIRGASRALPQRGVPCMPALPRWRYDGARRAHATVSSRHAS